MYASNRYEREMMRIPRNYSGNAFSQARSREQESESAENVPIADPSPKGQPDPLFAEHEAVIPSDFPDHADDAASSYTVEREEETTRSAPMQTRSEGKSDGLLHLRDGLGEEELMLLGLLYLLHSSGHEGGGDEVIRLLLLLLLIG